ncbi:MAG: CHAP domain-containing protein [Acutalibacteraceae bacterium]|nr:CHAP domain-containing protein [Acutalibacteraceae bacterium]
MKKILSILSVLIIIFSIASTSTMIADAASNPYGKYQTINGVTTVRCTWYAWEQAYSNTGAIMPNFGNAKNWYTSAKNNGFKVGSEPKAKSIAVWTDSGYGHVGYVVSVNGSKITVNEGGMLNTNGQAYNGTGILNGSICNSEVGSKKSNYSSKILVGYIYLTNNSSVNETVVLKADKSKNTISNNNAVLWGRVDKPSNYAVTKIGIKVRQDNSTYNKGWEKYEAPSKSYVGYSYMYPYYDLKSELNANLTHGTKYYYRFYAVVNGKEYWSDEYNFTTGNHNYINKAEAKYLKSAATCKSKAVYYKSCSVCGEKSTSTFEYGNVSTIHSGGTHINGQKDATNDEKGYTGDTVCNSCGQILKTGNYTNIPTLIKQNGVWYYYSDEGKKVDETTLCKYNGTWYYVKNGILSKDNTLIKYNNVWYHVKGGKTVKDTTLVKYNNVWYYVKNGKLNKDNTLVKYNNVWYHVKNGKKINDTTLVKYNNKWYYVQKGKVNFKANTKVNYNGKVYTVRNGVVV